MAKKARTSRPRRAAAPADGFAAPPADDMDIEEEEQAPRRRKQKEAPLVPLEHVIAKCPRAELEDLILASAKNNEPVTREDLEAAAARHAPPPKAVIELGNEREGTPGPGMSTSAWPRRPQPGSGRAPPQSRGVSASLGLAGL